jgi:hypothetical protein
MVIAAALLGLSLAGCARNTKSSELQAFVLADVVFTEEAGTVITEPDGTVSVTEMGGVWMSTNYLMRVGRRIIEELPVEK